jgi:hypothetical protein
VPITMDVSWIFGDPDVLGTSAHDSSVATLTAPQLAPGVFLAQPQATGPFPTGGVGAGATVSLAATARASRFDPAVSASSGDVWKLSVSASASYTPLSLGAGQRGTIKLTFTPSAPKGTVVRGFIDVDTFSLFTASGDQLISIPYTYRVG